MRAFQRSTILFIQVVGFIYPQVKVTNKVAIEKRKLFIEAVMLTLIGVFDRISVYCLWND